MQNLTINEKAHTNIVCCNTAIHRLPLRVLHTKLVNGSSASKECQVPSYLKMFSIPIIQVQVLKVHKKFDNFKSAIVHTKIYTFNSAYYGWLLPS